MTDVPAHRGNLRHISRTTKQPFIPATFSHCLHNCWGNSEKVHLISRFDLNFDGWNCISLQLQQPVASAMGFGPFEWQFSIAPHHLQFSWKSCFHAPFITPKEKISACNGSGDSVCPRQQEPIKLLSPLDSCVASPLQPEQLFLCKVSLFSRRRQRRILWDIYELALTPAETWSLPRLEVLHSGRISSQE